MPVGMETSFLILVVSVFSPFFLGQSDWRFFSFIDLFKNHLASLIFPNSLFIFNLIDYYLYLLPSLFLLEA